MAPRVVQLAEVVGEGWKRLRCPKTELRLDIVLTGGQSFRWRTLSPGIWASVLHGDVWILSQSEEEILYKVYPSSQTTSVKTMKKELTGHECVLRDYFQLDKCKLSELYSIWRNTDPYFEACCDDFLGVRTLRQDPSENLFAFVCSSNNNISRISSMVENLCLHFGNICEIEIKGETTEKFHAFPPIERLAAEGVEEKLRNLGFGYRAKFIQKSATAIMSKGGESWLHGLRTVPYEEAKAELLKLCGVGAKVADCVCLMSLDKNGAIPVDTHVWQIAKKHVTRNPPQVVAKDEKPIKTDSEATPISTNERKPETEKEACVGKTVITKGHKRKSDKSATETDYNNPKMRTGHDKVTLDRTELMSLLSSTKTLTPRVYDAIGDYFRSVWGAEFAGWAQTVVFAADLRMFKKEGGSQAEKGAKKVKKE